MREDTRRLTKTLVVCAPLVGGVVVLVSTGVGGPQEDLARMSSRLMSWALLPLVIPMVLLYAERFPPRAPWGRWLAIHGAGMLGMTAIRMLHMLAAALILGWTDSPIEYISARWSNFFKYGLLLYPALAAQVFILQERRRAHRSALVAARLERRLASMRLERMRAGIEPRAIFAALDDIDGQIRINPPGASERIQALSRFLRTRLETLRTTPRALLQRRRKTATPRLPLTIDRAALLVYPLFGLSLNASLAFFALITGGGHDWLRFGTGLIPFVAAGALSFIVVRGSRWALARGSAAPAVLMGAFCCTHALLVEGCNALLRLRGWDRTPGEALTTTLIISVVMACLVRIDELERRRGANRVAAEESARLIHEARLKNLSSHIAPHFLFNTLNSVLTLVTRNTAAAELMLGRLRRLLNVAIDDRREEVSLREELEVTNDYIEIERVRFGANLDVRVDVDETLLAARVPHFLLQPLVENAIRHGVLGSTGFGRIRVSAKRSDGYLRLSVENDGDILDSNAWQEGIGLAATRARLTQRYGGDQELAIDVDGGVTVHIRVPLQLPEAA